MGNAKDAKPAEEAETTGPGSGAVTQELSKSQKKRNKKKKAASTAATIVAASVAGADETPDASHRTNVDVAGEESEDEGVASEKAPEQSNGLEANPSLEIAELDSMQDEPSDHMKGLLDAKDRRIRELEQSVSDLHDQLSNGKDQNKAGELDTADLQSRIASLEREKAQLDGQYRGLLSKLASIKKGVAERIQADEEEIRESRQAIEQLESVVQAKNEALERLQDELRIANEEAERLSTRISSLQEDSRGLNSDWAEERMRLISSEQAARQHISRLEKEVGDWESMAIEERNARDASKDRIRHLEEMTAKLESDIERLQLDHAEENGTLRQALSLVQDERKRELRECVDSYQAKVEQLTERVVQLERQLHVATERADTAEQEKERLQSFELAIKEKNLLIGKLRHEAVILNEHLIKAMKVLKKGASDEMVDKQLVTNLFLSFLSLPRADTKRFEVLQLMASMLGWNDEQRATAGLLRPADSAHGGSAGPGSPNLVRSPTMGLSRASSSSTLNGAQSVSSQFISFLEREAASIDDTKSTLES